MTRTALKRAISQLSDYQIDKIQKMVLEFPFLNHELEVVWPETCPKCGANEHSFVKKGFSRGKQRFQCKCCQKKFTYDSQQITFYSHQSTEAWIRALEATLRLDSLKETAQIVGVCRSTVFYMRHKLLAFMEKALEAGDVLDGLVEADETYVPESQKGRKVTHRKARLHGESVNLRGSPMSSSVSVLQRTETIMLPLNALTVADRSAARLKQLWWIGLRMRVSFSATERKATTI